MEAALETFLEWPFTSAPKPQSLLYRRPSAGMDPKGQGEFVLPK